MCNTLLIRGEFVTFMWTTMTKFTRITTAKDM